MKFEIHIKSREGRFSASATYDSGKIIVHPGGFIQKDFAKHIPGGKTALSFRENPEYVDCEGRILQDCVFTSPSTAAQFVTGRTCNGYTSWRVNDTNLGKYLQQHGLR